MKKIIICEYHPWDTDFRVGDHHYARIFLDNGWDVLWISHPVSPLHSIKPENASRIERAKNGPFRHANGPVELVPLTLLPVYGAPLLSSGWVFENSHRFFSPTLATSLDKAGFASPDVVWITDIVMHSVADEAKAKALVVRIADDNTEFRNVPKVQSKVEKKLAGKADVVFVTSSPLEDRLHAEFGSKVQLLRNGVDFSHFQGEFERPEEFKAVSGPVAIYVGAIEEWFDAGWVETLARARQDVTIVLIGKPKIDIAMIARYGNVLALGPKPYEKLPAYLAHSDCGIIPFRRTKLIESVSPLKLFEFFAAGLPVVSTRWTELERLDSPALLASYDGEFVNQVSRAIDEHWKKQRGEQFRSFAKENSWDARFKTVMRTLETYID